MQLDSFPADKILNYALRLVAVLTLSRCALDWRYFRNERLIEKLDNASSLLLVCSKNIFSLYMFIIWYLIIWFRIYPLNIIYRPFKWQRFFLFLTTILYIRCINRRCMIWFLNKIICVLVLIYYQKKNYDSLL